MVKRWLLVLFSSFLLLPRVWSAADSVVVFNEVNYNPGPSAAETEWIELKNLMGVDVDLSGWQIDRGVTFEFAEGVVIPGHGFLLVAAEPGATSLNGKNALGPFAGGISNGGERLRLVNNNGRVMDELTYQDDGDWPVGPDGGGVTLSKRREASANSSSDNWVASPEVGGTPGGTNFANVNQQLTQTVLIALGDFWRYYEDAAAPSSDWNEAPFEDSSWLEAGAGFFVGEEVSDGAGEGLLGYWPLDESSGSLAPNEVASGSDAQLFNGATWLTDAERGQVLNLNGDDAYANAGVLPLLDLDSEFTWSFWAYNVSENLGDSVILGNRRNSGGQDFSPREFIKFTPNRFEWHENANPVGDIDYAPIPANTWVHHALVKDGPQLSYYRNGIAGATSSINSGVNHGQPFYFGGDQTIENWDGRLDEIAIWDRALPAMSVQGLADESLSPATAPTLAGTVGLVTGLGADSSTYYFRRTFDYDGALDRTSLSLQLQVDDGAVVYLNGEEVYRENMPTGVVGHSTFATNEVETQVLSSEILIPVSALVTGSNTLAVSVHQSAQNSTDMVFRASLVANEFPPQLEELNGELAFSEIQAFDATQFQIELVNKMAATLPVDGYVIRSSGGSSYTLSASELSPGARLVLSAADLGFAPDDNERLFLFRAGEAEFVDSRSVTGRLRGLDSQGRWAYPTSASFGSENVFQVETDIVINEIMYHPRPLRQPASRSEVLLLDWDAVWRYNDSGNDVGNDWELTSHSVGNEWQAGAGPLGFEDEPLLVPIVTPTAAPVGRAMYFETDFTLSAAELDGLNEIELNYLIDDGAIFYLNGIEISRYRMNPEPTTATTLATGGGEAVLVQGVTIPKSAFQAGSNRLSVEVHQGSIGSSDIVFGLQLKSVLETPASIESDTQWIELYNRGSATIELSDWSFTDGIDFTFATGTTLEAGGYLVIARDAATLSAELPEVTVLGDWEGSLSRSGERLALEDEFGNVVDELRYYDDGSWPAEADGGGASLELVDVQANNENAMSWLASNEAERSEWRSYSYRASGSNHRNDPTLYNEFIFGLLDNGELLIDDISVVEDPDGSARELIQNGGFTSGSTQFWRLIGTHRFGEVIDDPFSPGNKVLHLHTTGSVEHMHNQASTTLKNGGNFVTINGNLDYEISFRARWLSGSNQFHSRLYFNRAARTTLLSVPDGGGTPGAVNSRAVSNAGPLFSQLKHAPVVPEAGESCLVSVQVEDPDGLLGLTLFYSVDGEAFESVAMTEQGEGSWSGVVPGQSAASKVQFYCEAEDQQGMISQFPPGGPASRAIIPIDDGQANLDYGDCQPNNFRIVMTDADRELLHEITNVMSNDRLGCTVIWQEQEVYYGCKLRLKGSQRGRTQDSRIGFNIRFPADQLFLGAHETVAVDRSGGNQFSQQEILVKHVINHAGGGIPGMNDDLIRVIAPRTQQTGSAMLLKSRYDGEFLNHMYENGGDGTAWEYELIYYPTSTVGGDPEGLKIPNPDVTAAAPFASLGSDLELYRWHWLIKNNRDDDNYSPLVEMVSEYGMPASEQYHSDMRRLIDVDQFLRAFAVQNLAGVTDNYSTGGAHNAFFYQRPQDGRFLYLPWDMDWPFILGATSSLTPSGDLRKLLTSEANRRAYYGHIHDIVTTSYNTSYLAPWAAHYDCFLTGSQNLSGFMNYVSQRGSYALGQVNSQVEPLDFALTTTNSSTSDSVFVVEGEGWVNVREIRLAGSNSLLSVVWIDEDSFRVQIPVSPGTHTYTFEAYDFAGQLLATDSIEITGQGDVIPATFGNLVVSELMFNPSASAGEDADDYEFVELLNTSASASLDLTGVEFRDGIAFVFPSLILAPGGRVVVPRNLSAFQSRYGGAALVTEQYMAVGGSNKLSNGGERIELVDALGNTIQDFIYDDSMPWPTSADGDGYSLELINPHVSGTDPTGAISWRSSRTQQGNPGTSDSELLEDWAEDNNISDLGEDPDRDGQTHLLEFLFGTDPFVADNPTMACRLEGGWFVMEIVVRNGGDGLLFVGGKSSNLVDWEEAEYLGRLNNEDEETSTLGFGSEILPGDSHLFLHLEAEEIP